MAQDNSPPKKRFTTFVHAHKLSILPLLGDEKIADILEEEDCDEEIHPYENLSNQLTGIKALLKLHQLDGVAFLFWLRKNNAHGILADEMGLGKTLQVLSFFQLIKNTEKESHGSFLVVCPLSVLSSWQNEVDTWTSLKAVQWYGNSENRRAIWQVIKKQAFDIILTTYETVIADNIRISRMGPWNCVVLDEGHRIKNFATKLTTSVKCLKTRQRLILTGTPVQNDLSEVWSMCNFLYPETFVKETLQHWKEAFSLSNGSIDSAFLDDVREFLKVIMLRRLKQSVSAGLQLPEKKEITLQLPLTREQKYFYLETITGCSGQVEVAANEDSSHALPTPPPSPGTESFTPSHFKTQDACEKESKRSVTNTLMELRKVCVHPSLVENMGNEDEDAEMVIPKLVSASTKFIALKKLLDHEVIRDNKKVLIFSGFDSALNCCQMLLDFMKIPHLRLDGSTPYARRRFNVDRFQKMEEYQVFIIATRAGGEGITLTAAEIVVFMDIDWNPQVMAQAEARVHRIGQTKPVTVFKLCNRGTIEEQMLNRVSRKLYLASKVISNSAAGNSEMSIADSLESEDILIQRLISRSFTSVTVDTCSADDLVDMSWEQIVKSCQHTKEVDDSEPTSQVITPPSPSADSFDEQEKHWLSQSARIKTGLFNGMIFSRRRASLKGDIPADIDPSQRRLGKSRTVFDPEIGYFVNKQSTFCKDGEAVPTITDGNTLKVKKTFDSGFQHLKTCMVCARTKNLEQCTYCPEAYHKKCVDRLKESPKNNPIHNAVCTKHSCAKCGRTANKAGGLLLSCNKCPSAYCIDCLDLDTIKSIDGELPQYKGLGYTPPRHIQYITCGGCVAKTRKGERKSAVTSSDGRILRRTKRAPRFAFE